MTLHVRTIPSLVKKWAKQLAVVKRILGVCMCGTGVGISNAANKVPGKLERH